MRSPTRWLAVITAMALIFVVASSVAQAVRQGSWGPIGNGLFIPAVVLATCWPGAYRRCRPRR